MKTSTSEILHQFGVFCASTAIAALSAFAQPVRVSGTLTSGGDVTSNYAISPNGAFVVFMADRITDGVVELYSARQANGSITNISGGLVAGGNVTDFSITPDGSRVIFLANKAAADVFELYSVPIAGGSVTNLSGLLVPGGNVDGAKRSFQISADSSRVVFRADKIQDNVFELWSVPVSGGGVTQLSGPMVVGGDALSDFKISPDSSRVVFVADQTTDEVDELYSVPIGGGTVTNISGPMVLGGDIYTSAGEGFFISPDSSRVVFAADKTDDSVYQLYSVPIAGGAVVNISGPMVSGGDVDALGRPRVQISADSARVVFLADKTTDETTELFSVPIDGGTVTNISGSLVSGGQVRRDFRITPDSSRVVFNAQKPPNTTGRLFSVAIDGGAITTLSDPLIDGNPLGEILVSPDSTRVVYRAQKITSYDIYSVSILGGAITKISDMSANVPNNFFDFSIGSDGKRVVFRGDPNVNNVYELFSAPIAGGTVTTLSGPIVSGGSVHDYAISADSARIVFRADKTTDEVDELWRVQIGGAILALDVDGDDRILPLTDLLMLTRYQLGIRGSALIANALGVNATRRSVSAIEDFIEALLAAPAP
jgi:Tol biopolymer transport system component